MSGYFLFPLSISFNPTTPPIADRWRQENLCFIEFSRLSSQASKPKWKSRDSRLYKKLIFLNSSISWELPSRKQKKEEKFKYQQTDTKRGEARELNPPQLRFIRLFWSFVYIFNIYTRYLNQTPHFVMAMWANLWSINLLQLQDIFRISEKLSNRLPNHVSIFAISDCTSTRNFYNLLLTSSQTFPHYELSSQSCRFLYAHNADDHWQITSMMAYKPCILNCCLLSLPHEKNWNLSHFLLPTHEPYLSVEP